MLALGTATGFLDSARNDRSSKQRERFAFAMFHLVHGALTRRFVRAPANNLCPVPETLTGEMIVGNFNDNFGVDRFPFAASLGAPAARPARRVAGESGSFS